VELNVKFRLSQQKANQLDVRIALRRISQREVLAVIVDLAVIVSLEMTDREKCIRQFVLTVELNVKFRLSQQKANQFFVRIVTGKARILINSYFSGFILFFIVLEIFIILF